MTVPASGKVLLILTAALNRGSDDATEFMSFAVSGGTTRGADDATSLRLTTKHADVDQMSATYVVTGLTAGSNTFRS